MTGLARQLEELTGQVARLEAERDELRRELQRRGDQVVEAAAASYLTVEEVMQLARCSESTIRRAVRSGDLKGSRHAHRLAIREQDVHAWIEAHPAASRARPQPRMRRGRNPAPGSVAALRAIDPELSA